MSLLGDVRFNLRALRQSPGFAATAIITMALGIGATTAIFSVCDTLLWKPVKLPHLEDPGHAARPRFRRPGQF